MAIKDNGTINTWTFEKNDNETYEEGFIRKYWAPYIKIIKNCGSSPENDCAYDVLALNGKPFTFFATDANSDFSRIYLANGAAISVYVSRNNTTGEPASANFLIDTNGWKKPNKVGIDIFPFMYNPNSTNEKRKFMFGFPSYGDARLNITDAYGGCDKTLENRRTGIYCLSLIYKNGWKIPTVDEYVKTAGGDESYRAKYPWNF